VATVRNAALAGAALLWLAAGVVQVIDQSAVAPRAPAWAPVLAPLAAAPLAPGTAVALLEPIGQDPVAAKPLLMEAMWQRPDLHWARLAAFPSDHPPEALVALGSTVPPPGWQETWRRGAVALYRQGIR
jgi:hypothetical protein